MVQRCSAFAGGPHEPDIACAATNVAMNIPVEIRRRAKLSGHFTLRSGRTSPTYFDKYQFESDPTLLKAIAVEMPALVPREAEILAGLEMGGIPIVTVLSRITGLPAAF